MRKLAVILGVLAVVLIVILSAGCTGYSSTPISAIAGDKIVGNWLASGAELQLNSGGTGTLIESSFGMYKSPVTWKKTGDKSYEITGPNSFHPKTEHTYHYVLSSDGKTLTSNDIVRNGLTDYVYTPFVKQ